MTSTIHARTAHAEADAGVFCPLCEYDLRGLAEPRCPECGYRFTWEELNDPARRLHPFLFEHHPERNAWSFRQTLLGGLRPGRFWRTLFPTQPSRPRRLVVYWLIASCFAMLPVVTQYVRHAFRYQQIASDWRGKAAQMTPAQFNAFAPWVLPTYGSVQTFYDTEYPLWPSPRAALKTWRHASYDWAAQWAAVVLIGWPWLTFAALMVFQVSMRRVRIRPIHVLRCVLYASDVAVWVALLALLAIGIEMFRFRPLPTGWGWRFDAAGRAAWASSSRRCCCSRFASPAPTGCTCASATRPRQQWRRRSWWGCSCTSFSSTGSSSGVGGGESRCRERCAIHSGHHA
jgi:hypothetical protein